MALSAYVLSAAANATNAKRSVDGRKSGDPHSTL